MKKYILFGQKGEWSVDEACGTNLECCYVLLRWLISCLSSSVTDNSDITESDIYQQQENVTRFV